MSGKASYAPVRLSLAFMKNIIMVLGLVTSLSALLTGCGAKPSKSQGADSASHLSAAELARLLDFHAWKIPVPQSLQPSSGIRLVFVKSDGTTVKACGFGTTAPPQPWSNILVGLRLERGVFIGTLEARDSKGGASTWPFSFTNIISSDRPRSWVLGSALWKGNRAELADFWESARSGGGRDETNFSVLAVELVK